MELVCSLSVSEGEKLARGSLGSRFAVRSSLKLPCARSRSQTRLGTLGVECLCCSIDDGCYTAYVPQLLRAEAVFL